jgi:hypothetical protein
MEGLTLGVGLRVADVTGRGAEEEEDWLPVELAIAAELQEEEEEAESVAVAVSEVFAEAETEEVGEADAEAEAEGVCEGTAGSPDQLPEAEADTEPEADAEAETEGEALELADAVLWLEKVGMLDALPLLVAVALADTEGTD